MSKKLLLGRCIWVFLLGAVFAGAWFSGERILYLTLVLLVALPVVSYVMTFLLLRGLKVFRNQPDSIVKNATGKLTVQLHNRAFLPLGNAEVSIRADEHAMSVLDYDAVTVNPFGKNTLEIPFVADFRGFFEFGLESVMVTDITGLFKLRRKFSSDNGILVLPAVSDLTNFPLTMNLMTQATSRYDIRDEDSSTISDIRQYLPTDSIKRVHWKLTAKRNEWLVKTFQSNALNRVSIIFDAARLPLHPREVYALEDHMIEDALGLAKFCLNRGMPVDFVTTDGRKSAAKSPAEFEIIYQAGAVLEFTQETALDCTAVLSRELSEATGYVNGVILTARLDGALYERILNAANNGHYIAIMYFDTPEPQQESEDIFKLLQEGTTPCFRVAFPAAEDEAFDDLVERSDDGHKEES
jgi:uncharacterized protein (DUF58 family)